MNIIRIDLSENGFKGASVAFYQEEEKDGKKIMVLHKVYPKNPIHLGLEKLFKDLRIHLLELTEVVHEGMDKNIVDMKINQTRVQIVEMDGSKIVIKGDKDSNSAEDKTITLKSYKLQEGDSYEHYESVKAIIDRIQEETKEYLSGSIKADEVETALRWAETKKAKAKGVDLDAIKALSPEKLKEWATKLLETSFGSVVMHNDEIGEDIDLTQPMEELESSFPIDESEEGTVIEMPAQPEKAKRGKKAEIKVEVAVPLTQTNEEF